MRIGILTAGGDCPGINATIRGVCKTAINHYGMEVMGIHSGFQGLLTKDAELFTESSLSGLLNLGGTMLGTSREKPFKKNGVMSDVDKPALIEKNAKEMGLDCIVCIGGNGTQKTAAKFAARGMNIVSVPKTIDNDIWGTDFSFGFDSAVSIATDAIDRLHSTASSHKRVMVIEVMGHRAGWIALYSGMAGGGDVILIPEIPYDIRKIGETILNRLKKGKPYSIVVVAEGIRTDGKKRAAEYIAQEIEYETGIETRETVLGYIQRGGSPTPFDRNLSTRMGGHATELIANGLFGRMITLKGNDIDSISLEEIAGKLKLVTEECDLVVQGRRMGICFG
ncbi:6-phosphofructokinase 1 [Bacteroides zoogleoformans]|uniref:ATP-dependent 6-phosphofructokinase n=1 Tax=Bacteroides zoogleoformans TaxID=28119 RepID=A0ABM6T8E6_9BACE|nr:ATP-dependent 6-phosphofructokinase [Bacteroides zoogleoformans]AVM52879.1 6-phosphofructokinase [Bacteroides zoogleoformans]TWJ18592.1 6-phosphofructokinase 1 [Bacteroides zoogleoformans]